MISYVLKLCGSVMDEFIRKEYREIVIDSWKFCPQHKPEDWSCCSAGDFYNKKGMIDLSHIL
jgi:hypothetical protein